MFVFMQCTGFQSLNSFQLFIGMHFAFTVVCRKCCRTSAYI